MAVFGVINNNDDGIGSLRRALELANSNDGLDTIRIFQALVDQTVSLTSGELVIEDDVVIEGIDSGRFTISGNNDSRVFVIDDGNDDSEIHVEINDVTIADGSLSNGLASTGAGILNQENLKINRSTIRDNSGGSGGVGIDNRGMLRLFESEVIDNQTIFAGGVGSAAGITNNSSGTAEIINSLIRGNSTFRTGAGITNRGELTISNTTITENLIDASQARSGLGGAGVLNTGSGVLAIDYSTIVGNQVQLGFDDLEDDNLRGAGIHTTNSATTTISNSIVADNLRLRPGGDIDSTNDVFGTFDSDGYNLIGDSTGSSGFTATGDQTGTTASPLDPELEILRDNGGRTETYAPLAGSPAIDAANPFDSPDTDQRGLGFPRRIDGDGNGVRVSDIGAFEFNPDFLITFSGGGGDDQRFGGDSDNLIRGFAGDDTLDGQDGDDVIEGGDGDDILRGRVGRDVVFGNRGDDRVVGGQNNDTLIGGVGFDTVEGGGGRDRIIWNSGDGFDTVRGGNGLDTVEINGASGGRDEFRVAEGGAELVVNSPGDSLLGLLIEDVERLEINGLGGNDRLTVEDISATSVTSIQFDGGKGNDLLLGASSNLRLEADGGDDRDILFGSGFNDILDGGDGNDIVLGLDGNDFLSGGLGNDAVVGGDGSDFISENGGNDLLTGGAGSDRFAFFGNTDFVDGLEAFDRDIIRDFERGIDTLELLFFNGLDFGDLDSNNSGVLDGSDNLISTAGGNTRILLGNFFGQASSAHTIQLTGVTGLTSSDVLVF